MSFDRNNAAHLATLKGMGLAIDPTGGNTVLIVETINSQTTTVSKPKISSALVRSTCTYDAYNSLVQDEQEWLQWMTGTNGFDEENMVVTPDLRARLAGPGNASIWNAGNRDEMNAAMLALIDVPGSAAEAEWGYGTSITRDDWIAARDS